MLFEYLGCVYKFRSMYADSEKNGPQLSSKYDSRITNIGRFMRKTRLDETPQFFNVIKGDMSLVGPRPERQYFINKISAQFCTTNSTKTTLFNTEFDIISRWGFMIYLLQYLTIVQH